MNYDGRKRETKREKDFEAAERRESLGRMTSELWWGREGADVIEEGGGKEG